MNKKILGFFSPISYSHHRRAKKERAPGHTMSISSTNSNQIMIELMMDLILESTSDRKHFNIMDVIFFSAHIPQCWIQVERQGG